MINFTEIRFIYLAINIIFWTIFFIHNFNYNEKIFSQASSSYLSISFILLFIPLGLIMTFLHEIGHAIWGIVAGGKLTYMKIAYLEIYPYLTLSSKFVWSGLLFLYFKSYYERCWRKIKYSLSIDSNKVWIIKFFLY